MLTLAPPHVQAFHGAFEWPQQKKLLADVFSVLALLPLGSEVSRFTSPLLTLQSLPLSYGSPLRRFACWRCRISAMFFFIGVA
jgi:hypothetical protein